MSRIPSAADAAATKRESDAGEREFSVHREAPSLPCKCLDRLTNAVLHKIDAVKMRVYCRIRERTERCAREKQKNSQNLSGMLFPIRQLCDIINANNILWRIGRKDR